MSSGPCRLLLGVLTLVFLTAAPFALAQDGKAFEPVVGQAGKDVVWVPTPPELVEKMLDLAQITAKDYVIDLGSGDGRNVIAAAKRGARSLGVEYNPEMVALSKRNAKSAGVSSRASFVQGDMYEADISRATALALFLLPSNMFQLKEKFLALPPGTRIVSNTFGVEGWQPDGRASIDPCSQQWCTALLWIVPAKVDGTWRAPEGEMILEQEFQFVTGALGGRPVADGKLNGDRITFAIGTTTYEAKVSGDSMQGTATTETGARSRWTARRAGARS